MSTSTDCRFATKGTDVASIRAYTRRALYDRLTPMTRRLLAIEWSLVSNKIETLKTQGLDVLWLVVEDDYQAVDLSVEFVFIAGRRGVPKDKIDQTCDMLEREFYHALERTGQLPQDCVRGFAPQPNVGGSYQVIKKKSAT